jgi:1-acyl-sn-glycerol-3-phosphate acyltransferase
MFNVSPAPRSPLLAPAGADSGTAPATPPASPPSAPSASSPHRAPTPGRVIYGLYAWLQFLCVGVVTLLLLVLPGSLARRRARVAAAARLTLRLAGIRVHVVMPGSPPGSWPGNAAGGATIGPGALSVPCVVVANHCSYLDGVLLAAMLPPDFSFVIKREMSRVPLAGLLLRRIGVEFMERRDQGRVMRDARRVLRQAAGGQSLVFFPEGTFSREVGLLRFHIGAFTAAARARLPVVPLAIHGSRHCLPPGSPWPRPGRILIELLPPIAPAPPLPPAPPVGRWHASERAAELRRQARAALLAALHEPDLEQLAQHPTRAPGEQDRPHD